MREAYLRLDPGWMAINPWFEQDAGARLRHDQALVAARYPGLAYRVELESGRVYIEGQLVLRDGSGVPERIAIRIAFALDYPKSEPMVYDAGTRFPYVPDRHFYRDGRCCLWLPPESRWDREKSDGLGDFLDEVAVFFDRQLVCDVVGYFPGAQRAHGIAGYIEFVQEYFAGDERLMAALGPVLAELTKPAPDGRCPCGSGRRYRRCHLGAVDQLRQQVGQEKLREIFGRRVIIADRRQG